MTDKTVYCKDKERRVWNLGHEDFCPESPDGCSHLVKIGRQLYCGYCPGRCGLHQIIRDQAGCLWCKHYVKSLDCAVCLECLSAETRINFRKRED